MTAGMWASDNIFIMLGNYQQIKQATRRRNNGLFFLKSKHARPHFHNHSYFHSPAKPDERTHRHATIQQAQPFVGYPSGYGIDNTFNYLCERIRLAKVGDRLAGGKAAAGRGQAQGGQGQERLSRVRVASEVLQYRSSSEQAHNPTMQHSLRLNTEPDRKYLQTTQSFAYRIRTCARTCDPVARYPSLKPPTTDPACNIIEMVYMSGKERPQHIMSMLEGGSRVSFNLLPYILNCFLKCKVNYSKSLTQRQLDTIKKCIEQVKMSTKSYFDVKDIVNVSSVGEIMSMLEHYGEGSLEWVQTARYFFMPNEQVLDYQFNKALDQLKTVTAIKLGIQLSLPLFIYRMEDKVKISNLYDMLKPGTYVYSENKLIYEIYTNVMRRQGELLQYQNRIRKWRSMVPLDEGQEKVHGIREGTRESPRHGQAGRDGESGSKINRLFQLSKQRRRRGRQGGGVLITSQASISSFIDRSKLHSTEDIFE